MAGYTRQSQNDIYDGNAIEADHLNNEFDELQAAFNVVGGHSHDGSVNGGAYITKAGPNGGITFTDSQITPTNLSDTIDIINIGAFESNGDGSFLGDFTIGSNVSPSTTTLYGTTSLTGSNPQFTMGSGGSASFGSSVNLQDGATVTGGSFSVSLGSSHDTLISSRYVNITANTSGSSYMKGVQVGDSSNKQNGYFNTIYFNSISSSSGSISIGTGDITADEVTCDIVNTKSANSSSSTDAGVKFGSSGTSYYMFADNSKLYIKSSSTNWITFESQSYPNKINMHQEIQIMNTSWSVSATSQYVYFKNNGQNIMRLDTSGNLLIKGGLSDYQSFIS